MFIGRHMSLIFVVIHGWAVMGSGRSCPAPGFSPG